MSEHAPTLPELRAAADAAKRLLADRYLAETLDEITAGAVQLAIGGADAATREENRQMVLAVNRLRTTLQSVWEGWEMAVRKPADDAKWE